MPVSHAAIHYIEDLEAKIAALEDKLAAAEEVLARLRDDALAERAVRGACTSLYCPECSERRMAMTDYRKAVLEGKT